jgi:outer membrane biosynthesis protein TonB
MPEQLSLATVATCAVLAAAVFGGAYALAHDGTMPSAPPPASPAKIRLAHDSVGELHRVSALPALIVPAPRPEPVEPEPVVEDATPVAPVVTPEVPAAAPTPTPAPEPTPAPAPQPAPRKPLTFDDSG